MQKSINNYAKSLCNLNETSCIRISKSAKLKKVIDYLEITQNWYYLKMCVLSKSNFLVSDLPWEFFIIYSKNFGAYIEKNKCYYIQLLLYSHLALWTTSQFFSFSILIKTFTFFILFFRYILNSRHNSKAVGT